MKRLLSILPLMLLAIVCRAAQPSFNDFDPNQFVINLDVQPKIHFISFGTNGGTIYITNVTMVVTNVTINQTNVTINNSNVTINQTNVTINNSNVTFNGKTVFDTTITTNAFFQYITNVFEYTTNLFATTINSTTNFDTFLTVNSNAVFNSFSTFSNAYFTNIYIQVAQYATNKWIGPTNDVDFTSGVYQQFTASTSGMEITGLKGASTTNENTTVLLIDPGGSDRTLYFPNSWTNFTIDKANAYTIGSTNIAIVTLSQYGNQYTNVIVRLWGVIPTALPTDLSYVDKNNAWTSASSNYVNSVTGYATNSNTTTPDFAITGAESLLSTNNNFTWLAPTHIDQSGKVYQFIVIDVTNSSGSSKTMTLPANVHQLNAQVGLVVTNYSKTFWEYWPPSGPTNFIHYPGY